MQKQTIKTIALTTLFATNIAFAGDYDTAEEAKAMLDKAVIVVKEDKAKALEMFTKDECGFKDRDLYPYCGSSDGIFTAHIKLLGKSLKDLTDKTGAVFGEEIYAKAREGKIVEIPYMWPRPNETEPVQKVVFVTKIDDQICTITCPP
jgi:signal transduction histidine kinase